MAVPVPLDFIPPQEDNIVKLHIYESSAQGGPFSEIELVTEVGTWPNYIDHYTTANATALDDWFAIQWEDDKGAKSVLSSPVKGGTDYLVREVMDRMLQRDMGIDHVVALAEAQGAVEWYFKDDPTDKLVSDIDSTKRYSVLNGLTYLGLARAYIVAEAIHDKVEQANIGVVSFRTQAGVRSGVDVSKLVELANELLEINISTILQLTDVYDPGLQWSQWYEDWQVAWSQLPWITGIPHWELPA